MITRFGLGMSLQEIVYGFFWGIQILVRNILYESNFASLSLPLFAVHGIAIDDRRAYSLAAHEMVRIWSLQTGDCLYVLEFEVPPLRISLTPHFSYLSAWNRHQGLSIWDTSSGKLLQQLHGISGLPHIDDRKVLIDKEGKLT